MAKLLIVVGLPGSGKSTFIRSVKQDYPGIVAEDLHADAYDHSSRVTDSKHYAPLVLALREGKDSIIADIDYCDSWRRIEIEQVIRNDVPNVHIEWHFFENSAEMCKRNAIRRSSRHVNDE